jgi:hypothetical protein
LATPAKWPASSGPSGLSSSSGVSSGVLEDELFSARYSFEGLLSTLPFHEFARLAGATAERKKAKPPRKSSMAPPAEPAEILESQASWDGHRKRPRDGGEGGDSGGFGAPNQDNPSLGTASSSSSCSESSASSSRPSFVKPILACARCSKVCVGGAALANHVKMCAAKPTAQLHGSKPASSVWASEVGTLLASSHKQKQRSAVAFARSASQAAAKAVRGEASALHSRLAAAPAAASTVLRFAVPALRPHGATAAAGGAVSVAAGASRAARPSEGASWALAVPQVPLVPRTAPQVLLVPRAIPQVLAPKAVPQTSTQAAIKGTQAATKGTQAATEGTEAAKEGTEARLLAAVAETSSLLSPAQSPKAAPPKSPSPRVAVVAVAEAGAYQFESAAEAPALAATELKRMP